MIESLEIEGFRLFGHLDVPGLRRLNLIIGNNNSGKSCLLEAIRIYATEANPFVIRELVFSRDGDWEANVAKPDELGENLPAEVENPIRYLFRNFHYRHTPHISVTIGSIDHSRRVRLSRGLYRKVLSEDGVVHHSPVKDLSYLPNDEVVEMLEISVGGRRRLLIALDRLWARNSFALRRASEDFPQTPIAIVGTSGIVASEVAFLWDKVVITPQQDQILNCLRLIEPRIDGIALVGSDSRTKARTPVIRLRGSSDRYPLRSMGDGLTRLFHIALAMASAQGGLVLIDEFENGLYWEVQERLWPLIFQLAEAFDVQVFATSHSNDCLRSFTSAWHNAPESASLYRLERTESSVRASALPMINISDALASQVEIR